ncbi:PadR family transcriptional regulator [Sphingomonas astaxanthinifaciens DSM 22298]|uniref:PadR family transcriptional regulator n=1 Tax=Sphingomonas astaxanthinifaciens DSM 22298 TaxID=1123267 RepID=A0ABQ5Z939_9SPHN|nr:PadR family transcriptional regulator [Sphingomonas astaxanthinifaciens DSM 22298]
MPFAIMALAAGRDPWGPGSDWFAEHGTRDPFPGFRGGGRGGPRGRRMFGSGDLKLLLLRLIADEPRHGYDLIRTIEEKSGGAYSPSPGVVYPTLSFLADEGLIEEQAAEGSRKRFAATEAGRAHLEEMKTEVAAVLARLDAVRPEPRSGDRQLQRALDNLRAAMRNRVAETDWDAASVTAIIDILDEASKRIERGE